MKLASKSRLKGLERLRSTVGATPLATVYYCGQCSRFEWIDINSAARRKKTCRCFTTVNGRGKQEIIYLKDGKLYRAPA